MRPLALLGWSTAVAALGAACNAVTIYPAAVLRLPENVPERFVLADSTAIRGTPGSAACRSPIVDPRNGARLTLQRSSQGNGDYAAPAGSYGTRAGELLRVDCATGQTIGIVRAR